MGKDRLVVSNLGCIVRGEISLDGITVVTGKTCTGKSSLLKAAYVLLHGANQACESMRADIGIFIAKTLQDAYREQYLILDGPMLTRACFAVAKEIAMCDMAWRTMSTEEMTENLRALCETEKIVLENDAMREVVTAIESVFQIKIKEYVNMMLSDMLFHEFGVSLQNIRSSGPCRIDLHIDGQRVVYTEDGHSHSLECSDGLFLPRRTVYLDDPNVLDDEDICSNDNSSDEGQNSRKIFTRKEYLRKLLWEGDSSDTSVIESIIRRNDAKVITEALQDICHGSIVCEKSGILRIKHLRYKMNDSKSSVSLCNVSPGLKVFLILDKLVRDCSLKYGDLLIVDSVDQYMDEEWKEAFVNILQTLYKDLGIRVLISSRKRFCMQLPADDSEKTKSKIKEYRFKESVNGTIITC